MIGDEEDRKMKDSVDKIEFFCPECGGTDVKVQGWLSWNKENQD